MRTIILKNDCDLNSSHNINIKTINAFKNKLVTFYFRRHKWIKLHTLEYPFIWKNHKKLIKFRSVKMSDVKFQFEIFLSSPSKWRRMHLWIIPFVARVATILLVKWLVHNFRPLLWITHTIFIFMHSSVCALQT